MPRAIGKFLCALASTSPAVSAKSARRTQTKKSVSGFAETLLECHNAKLRLRIHRYGHWRRFRSRIPGSAHLAHLEPRKPLDHDVFAEVRYGLLHHLPDRHALVFDVALLVQAILFVKLFHLAGHDLFHHWLRLACRQRLRAVNVALFLQHVRRHFLAPHVPRIERRDVHGNVVAQILEAFRARHEVRLAVHFHEHTNLPARVNVTPHEPFARFALRLLRRSRLSLLSQYFNGLLDVARRFHQRRAAIAEPCAGPFAQLLHQMCWNLHGLLLCAHPFLLSDLFSARFGELFSTANSFLYCENLVTRDCACRPAGSLPPALATASRPAAPASLAKRPAPSLWERVSHYRIRSLCLARFLVRRHRRLGRFWRRFRALYKVAFLLLVLLVRARVHVLHAIHNSLICR